MIAKTALISLIVITICIMLWLYITAVIQWQDNLYYTPIGEGNYGYTITVTLFGAIGIVSAIAFLSILIKDKTLYNNTIKPPKQLKPSNIIFDD